MCHSLFGREEIPLNRKAFITGQIGGQAKPLNLLRSGAMLARTADDVLESLAKSDPGAAPTRPGSKTVPPAADRGGQRRGIGRLHRATKPRNLRRRDAPRSPALDDMRFC